MNRIRATRPRAYLVPAVFEIDREPGEPTERAIKALREFYDRVTFAPARWLPAVERPPSWLEDAKTPTRKR